MVVCLPNGQVLRQRTAEEKIIGMQPVRTCRGCASEYPSCTCGARQFFATTRRMMLAARAGERVDDFTLKVKRGQRNR